MYVNYGAQAVLTYTVGGKERKVIYAHLSAFAHGASKPIYPNHSGIQTSSEFSRAHGKKSHSEVISTFENFTRGNLIGVVGSTGNSTGEHLHFAITDTKGNGIFNSYTDYKPYFPKEVFP